MITVQEFTKSEVVRLKYQGEGIFQYKKLRILKDGREMTTVNMNEAKELRDALIAALPQGLYLYDFVR